MIFDAKEILSDKQALTASGASTNSIDFGKDRNVGIGEPLAVVILVDVALAGTGATFTAKVQTDDNSGFSSPTDLLSSATYSSLAVNDMVVIPIAPDLRTEQHLRVYYELATGATITVTTALVAQKEIRNWAKYPAGYTIV